MHIEFYFDPSCPFSWITSRWLLRVSSERDIEVTWRPFSLALKNDQTGVSAHGLSDHDLQHYQALRVLRVIQVAAKSGTSLIDLYTDFGIQRHVVGDEFDDAMIAKILDRRGLPKELFAAADSTACDNELKETIGLATAVAGEDIGVPTIIFTLEDGSKNGYFGPVLQTLPKMDEALKLWDGLSLLATSKSFYELKRSRPDGQPDVFSTARC